MLRDYQQDAIDKLYDYLEKNKKGNPCLVLPTGAGKSWIIAKICSDCLNNSKVLVLSHVKRILEQNISVMGKMFYVEQFVGVYSSSLKRRELGKNITVAGIQSVRNQSKALGHIDLVIIDEAHLVSHKEQGSYCKLLDELTAINADIRIVGFTATPSRLGHGLITRKPAIFDALIDKTIKIDELIGKGQLAPLRSKMTKEQLDSSGVKKRGDFITSELEKAFDKDDKNRLIIDEVIRLAENRTTWLIFCVSINHAEHIKDILIERGITAECITSRTPKKLTERTADKILDDFNKKKIRAICNVNTMTTGVDCPDIDLIVNLRITESPELYAQMMGRGLRLKSHTDHCLVLDFAGLVQKHGPITQIHIESPKKSKKGTLPTKFCKNCWEILHISVMTCTQCGFEFPPSEKKVLKLRNDDVLGIEPTELYVKEWRWTKHTSYKTNKTMLKVTYYSDFMWPSVFEYLTINHDGYARDKARETLEQIAEAHGATDKVSEYLQYSLDRTAAFLNTLDPPYFIEYRKFGKYYRISERNFTNTKKEDKNSGDYILTTAET